MTPEQALEIIKQACASIQANLQTHQTIQEAVKVIEQAIKKPVEPKKSEKT